MSKFEVGNRVVVVKNNHSVSAAVLIGTRGVVNSIGPYEEFEVSVQIDGEETEAQFDSSELELESVYDALSAPPVEEGTPEEGSSFDPKVDMSDKVTENFIALMESIPMPQGDVVNHPSHYADGWSNGAEVIDIAEHLNFNRGNAVKYLSRAGKKGGPEKELEDLQKALWYVTREVQRLGGTA